MLQVDDVKFSFPTTTQRPVRSSATNKEKHVAIHPISFVVEQGGITAIMGESGCGKSTLLNLVYGTLQADQGKIYWSGQELKGADHHLVPGHSIMKYVPQKFELMPFTTVFENVGHYLSLQQKDRMERIDYLLEILDLQNYKTTRVDKLSGGQQQRVAIAKALALEPSLLLLDEPFSHVDNHLKLRLRRRLFKYLKSNKISCLVATHDRDDVLSHTDHTMIMKDGKLVDHRTTKDVYLKPMSHYTAALFDDVNLIPLGNFGLIEDALIYPHQLKINTTGMEFLIEKCYFKGSHYLIYGNTGNLQLWVNHKTPLSPGSKVFVDIDDNQ